MKSVKIDSKRNSKEKEKSDSLKSTVVPKFTPDLDIATRTMDELRL